MQTSFWLRIGASKSRYGTWEATLPKTSKNKPSTGPGEIAIQVTMDLPESYFIQPEISAKITLPDVDGQRPAVTVDMEKRMAEELKKSLGIVVRFEQAEQESGNDTAA